MTAVHEFPGQRSVDGNGHGGDLDARLRAVEGDIREIKADLKHVATRAWVLAGVVGGMGLAATITLAIIRLFQQ